jgi:predicted tellurium resistance membrane protein TerC
VEGLLTTENAVALLTLSALEIVLGIDNIVFISILTGRLPERDRPRARFVGLSLAMLMRILLLLGIKRLMGLTLTLVTVPELLAGGEPHDLTIKDAVLLAGGLFLIVKATREIHDKIEGGRAPADRPPDRRAAARGFAGVIAQLVAVDLVFSLDSVITAVGMVRNRVEVMAAAVILAVLVMMLVAGRISEFVERRPTIKMLALAFLLLIGVMLTAESFGREIPKGYIYFAMAFSLGVEMLNLRVRKSGAAP